MKEKRERRISRVDLSECLLQKKRTKGTKNVTKKNLYKLRLSTLKLHKSHAHMYVCIHSDISYTYLHMYAISRTCFGSMDPNSHRSNHAKKKLTNILKLHGLTCICTKNLLRNGRLITLFLQIFSRRF